MKNGKKKNGNKKENEFEDVIKYSPTLTSCCFFLFGTVSISTEGSIFCNVSKEQKYDT